MNTIERYLDTIDAQLARVRNTQLEVMEQAAAMLAQATMAGHNLFAFGCNHAGLLALELYYRTGGMVNINPIQGPGLHLEITPVTMTSQMERLPGYGRLLIENTPVDAGDVVIIHSVSGRNTVTVDVALCAKEKGAMVIALTNLATSKTVTSRHESGKRLYEVADVVIDNCGCVGDAALDLQGVPTRVGPTSTAVGAAILNAVAARAVALVSQAGKDAPVFVSANIDGGDEHNGKVLVAYKDHIFYM